MEPVVAKFGRQCQKFTEVRGDLRQLLDCPLNMSISGACDAGDGVLVMPPVRRDVGDAECLSASVR